MNIIFGIFLSSAYSQPKVVPVLTPERAETVITALPATLTACLASPSKSKNPGASITFIFLVFHSTGKTEE